MWNSFSEHPEGRDNCCSLSAFVCKYPRPIQTHTHPFCCYQKEDSAGSCHDLGRYRATNHFYRSLSRLCYFCNFTFKMSETHSWSFVHISGWICRSSRNVFYIAFKENIKQEVGSPMCTETLFSGQILNSVPRPKYLVWKLDGGFTRTEKELKQLQSFVRLPDQLFTHCLLLYMRSKPLSFFSQEGHVWSSFTICLDSCPPKNSTGRLTHSLLA